MGGDLATALRRAARRPGFTVLAAGTLALGLAASTAVFTYVNAYNRPFPGVEEPGLLQVFRASPEVPWGALSYPDFQDLVARSGDAWSVAGVAQSQFAASARDDDYTGVVFGEAVTGGFFPLLSVPMALGRGLGPADDRPGADPAVVISRAYWAQRYASAPDVVGRTLLLNNEPYTIVGVAGREFLGSSSGFRPQFWLPFEHYMRVYWARSNRREDRNARAVRPLIRLPDGAPSGRVHAELAALAMALDRSAPLAAEARTFRVRAATWIAPATREAEASTTRIMMLAAACLLLLACANVANLVLSAGARRRRELALCTAVGASRGRLVRQLLAESLVVSTLAGVVALLLAGPVGARLSSYFARPSVWGANVPREIEVDPRVFLFALAVTLASGLVTGLFPALRTARRDPVVALKGGGRWAASGGVGRRSRLPGLQDGLVVAQVALTVLLVLVAGPVVRTLDAASRVDPGFDVDRTLASYVSTSSMGVPVEERHRFFEDLVRRFEALPWVEGATVAQAAPLSPHPTAELRIDGGDPVTTTVAQVWPGYFDVLGMDVLRGRPLEAGDTANVAAVVVVNEALAARMGGAGPVLGQTLWAPGEEGRPERGFEVVGVARPARQTTLLEDPGPVAYFSLPQHYSAPGNAFLVQVRDDPVRAVDRVERALRDVDTRMAIVNILPYRDVVRGFLYTQRMNAELFGLIAALGVLLAAAGVFGVVALSVTRRRREIGIRMAIGARRPSVVSLVIRAVAGPVAAGALLGVLGAVLAMRLVEGILWGVGPTDPVALAVGMALLVAALALALAVPVGRALRVDPALSLRAE